MFLQRLQISYLRVWWLSSSSAVIIGVDHAARLYPKRRIERLLARDFKTRFSDYYSIDLWVDVQVRRVFRRLGLIRSDASVEEVVYLARALHPPFPGLMDLPA